jgi:GH15 family glucan-1,4-alpha-glucosidase
LSKRIEDYGLIGNMLSCALVARDGSIEWLCLPRFDSDACLAALLGNEKNGHWRIAPAEEPRRITRRYRDSSTILETTFETDEGVVTLIDFMPLTEDEEHVDVFRSVRGDRGQVRMRMEFVIRFGYGASVPWVRRTDFGLRAIAGPDAVELHAPVALKSEQFRTVAEFSIGSGASIPFALCWHPSHRLRERSIDVGGRLEETERWWREWSGRCRFANHPPEFRRDAVVRSLVTLKALTYHPTGGVVAAPTTSLPEAIGGARNWDYRYCWIRDATLTLYALLTSGYREEANAWRAWMLRAAAGHPAQLQIMYGLAGERRLPEMELPWLAGYEGSKPVRIGNAAHDQLQLDVYGELMDALHVGRKFQLEPSTESWNFQKALLSSLERRWQRPDKGIWEVRGGSRHFTHSKLMAWVAYDRAVKGVEDFGLAGPVETWRAMRETICAEILKNGWSEKRQSFVQSYGSDALDASLLLIPLVGLLPPEDKRVIATIEAIQKELVEADLVLRYRPEETADGVGGREGTFLVCSFWLADALCMIGRIDEAQGLFERLLSLRNDLGLLAEEYDPIAGRQLGNFPQAFSHIGIVNTANNLASASGPAEQRADRAAAPAAHETAPVE